MGLMMSDAIIKVAMSAFVNERGCRLTYDDVQEICFDDAVAQRIRNCIMLQETELTDGQKDKILKAISWATQSY